MKDLLAVYLVYSACAIAVVIFGSAWDTYVKEHRVETVACSQNIVDRARKLRVTIVGECEVER